jgi:transposase, IS4 family
VNSGRTIFSQIMDYLPLSAFRKCVARYQGDYKVQQFSCMDQFLCMAFAQLSYRESLRDIETCLRAIGSKRYHMGIRSAIARSTLAHANETRDWRIYADLAQVLIQTARPLYAQEDLGIDLDNAVYALDSTTIDLCLSMFPWAKFRRHKAAVKMHTLLDVRGSIPTFIHISDGLLHDVNILDQLIPEAGSFYVMDRGYLDFARLYQLHQSQAFFVTRAKDNFQFQRLYSHPVDRTTGLICDQTIVVSGFYSSKDYPEKLRRIRYVEPETGKTLVFLTNCFTLPALIIALLYQYRWRIELFFKWIKQHLRIKAFFGTSENAVKTQIWIAVSVYVLVAILKKELRLEISLYTILQILSVMLFEKVFMTQVLTEIECKNKANEYSNQLTLFDL